MIGDDEQEYYEDLSLQYQEAAFNLEADIAAVVEDKEDEYFWSELFRHFQFPKSIYFVSRVKSFEKRNETGGTGQILKFQQSQCFNKKFIACIDSDYRYILQEENTNIQNFIFQTYTYSIENHKCFAEGIYQIFGDYEKEARELFDFQAFLKEYSKLGFDLFLNSVQLNKPDLYTKLIEIQNFKTNQKNTNIENNGEMELQFIANNIFAKLQEIKTTKQNEIEIWIKEVQKLGITAENAYLFMRGHNIFENIVLPLANKIKDELLKTVWNNEKESISKINIKEALSHNFYEKEVYFPLNKIQADINQFFS